MPYASLAELKAWVGIPPADTADDALLTLALDAASAQVDQFCDRTFTATTGTREYFPTDTGRLDVDPIATTTGLVVRTDEDGDGTFETTWATTDYRLEPVNAADAGEPWTVIVATAGRRFPRHTRYPGVQVDAAFGWPEGAPPAGIRQATLIQSARLWKRKDAPFGVAGSVEFGSEIRLLDELDREATRLLRPYRRNWWVI